MVASVNLGMIKCIFGYQIVICNSCLRRIFEVYFNTGWY